MNATLRVKVRHSGWSDICYLTPTGAFAAVTSVCYKYLRRAGLPPLKRGQEVQVVVRIRRR